MTSTQYQYKSIGMTRDMWADVTQLAAAREGYVSQGAYVREAVAEKLGREKHGIPSNANAARLTDMEPLPSLPPSEKLPYEGEMAYKAVGG